MISYLLNAILLSDSSTKDIINREYTFNNVPVKVPTQRDGQVPELGQVKDQNIFIIALYLSLEL